MLEEEAQLKYLGLSLEQTYGNWLAILWNINRARKSLGKTGKDYAKIWVWCPGFENVIQGSGTGGASFCIRVMIHVGSNVEDGVGYANRSLVIDHG